MRMRLVDGEIRSVHMIAKDLVGDSDRPVMSADVPLIRIRPRGSYFLPVSVERMHVEHVLREFVDGIPSRGGAAHPRLERCAGDPRPRHLDLGVMMLRLGE